MKLKFVIVNGFPGAGKDTFIAMCGEFADVVTLWTSSPAKRALKTLGWDGVKTPHTRKLLSDLKALSVEHFDGVKAYLKDEVDYIQHFFRDTEYLVFIHSREPEEIKSLVEEYGALSLLVLRGINQEELSNDSDRNVLNYNYSYTVDNDGDMGELRIKARDFVEYMKEVD